MKKLLFLVNSSKPSNEEYNSTEEKTLTNFSLPAVKAAIGLGLDVTYSLNRKHAEKITCRYPISFYNAEIYRNPYNFFEVRRAYKNACEELKKGDYVAIHCNTPIGGFVGRMAGKKCGIKKVIYTAHGFHFYKGASPIRWIIYYPIERLLAHYTDALITINKEDYKRAKSFKLKNNGKVYFVPGVGIETNDYEPGDFDRENKRSALGLKPDDIMVISAGDLIPRKNYKTSIEAIAKAGNPSIHYFICGKGKQQSKLIKLADDLGVNKQIHFLGYRDDVKELLWASDIFLFTTHQEGLPRSLSEAMAAGLPCLVSKIRGNTDLLVNNKGGYLYPSDCVEGFAKGLKKLAEDKMLRTKMGEFNKRRIKEFSSEAVDNIMKEIYKSEFEGI